MLNLVNLLIRPLGLTQYQGGHAQVKVKFPVFAFFFPVFFKVQNITHYITPHCRHPFLPFIHMSN